MLPVRSSQRLDSQGGSEAQAPAPVAGKWARWPETRPTPGLSQGGFVSPAPSRLCLKPRLLFQRDPAVPTSPAAGSVAHIRPSEQKVEQACRCTRSGPERRRGHDGKRDAGTGLTLVSGVAASGLMGQSCRAGAWSPGCGPPPPAPPPLMGRSHVPSGLCPQICAAQLLPKQQPLTLQWVFRSRDQVGDTAGPRGTEPCVGWPGSSWG